MTQLEEILKAALAEVTNERDALRAELAAAKERAGGLEEHIKGLREGTLAREAYRQRDEAFAQLDSVEAERTALAAHVERLEKGLRVARELTREEPDIYVVGVRRVINELLAATPAQSLAAHDAALLRKLADGVDKIAVVAAMEGEKDGN